MSDAGFTAGDSVWEMWPIGTKRPKSPVTEQAHTAREAWVKAWAKLGGLGFCELRFRRRDLAKRAEATT
jgi:hypothetical protein